MRSRNLHECGIMAVTARVIFKPQLRGGVTVASENNRSGSFLDEASSRWLSREFVHDGLGEAGLVPPRPPIAAGGPEFACFRHSAR